MGTHVQTPSVQDIDFAKYKAIAMACDNGTSFPSTPATGQWYYRTDIDTLFIYETGWKAIISFGPVEYHIDGTLGSDAVGKGYSSGAGAVKTWEQLNNILPSLNGGDITVEVAAGAYAENYSLDNVFMTGDYDITFNCATTYLATVTNASWFWPSSGIGVGEELVREMKIDETISAGAYDIDFANLHNAYFLENTATVGSFPATGLLGLIQSNEANHIKLYGQPVSTTPSAQIIGIEDDQTWKIYQCDVTIQKLTIGNNTPTVIFKRLRVTPPGSVTSVTSTKLNPETLIFHGCVLYRGTPADIAAQGGMWLNACAAIGQRPFFLGPNMNAGLAISTFTGYWGISNFKLAKCLQGTVISLNGNGQAAIQADSWSDFNGHFGDLVHQRSNVYGFTYGYYAKQFSLIRNYAILPCLGPKIIEAATDGTTANRIVDSGTDFTTILDETAGVPDKIYRAYKELVSSTTTNVTVNAGANQVTFTDTTKNFTSLGVEVGDYIVIVAEGRNRLANIISVTTTTVVCSGAYLASNWDTFGLGSTTITYQIFDRSGSTIIDGVYNGYCTVEDDIFVSGDVYWIREGCTTDAYADSATYGALGT